ncbi:MAG: ribbon-helix-helix protein, CopG family [Gemmatimonadales bacterium]
MAIPKIKATYSLDVETAQALERLAEEWGMSKSETLRVLIRERAGASRAAPRVREASPAEKLAALDALQKSMALTPATAAKWMRDVRAEREGSKRPKRR